MMINVILHIRCTHSKCKLIAVFLITFIIIVACTDESKSMINYRRKDDKNKNKINAENHKSIQS